MTAVGILVGWLAASPVYATVYYGKLEGATKPAVLVAQTVFDEIPEYREIKRRGLDEEDTDYWVLLAQANQKFYAAVKKVGDDRKFDVIVEKGSHEFSGTPTDITQAVIAALEK